MEKDAAKLLDDILDMYEKNVAPMRAADPNLRTPTFEEVFKFLNSEIMPVETAKAVLTSKGFLMEHIGLPGESIYRISFEGKFFLLNGGFTAMYEKESREREVALNTRLNVKYAKLTVLILAISAFITLIGMMFSIN